MRIFYDVPSTTERARTALLLADVGLLLTASWFAVSTLTSGAAAMDVVLASAWCALPRVVAEWVRSQRRIDDEPPGMALKVAGIAAGAVYLLLSRDLVRSMSGATSESRSFFTGLFVMLAWLSGGLLFMPAAYRLFDCLAITVMLVGAFRNNPGMFPWFAVFFLLLAFSSSLRHQLFDLVLDDKKRPPNVQNARALAFVTLVVGSMLYFGGAFAADGALEFSQRFRSPRTEVQKKSTDFEEISSPRGQRRVGLAPTLRLADVTDDPENDFPLLALSSRELGAAFRPAADALWKVHSFRKFDLRRGEWSDPETFLNANLVGGEVPFRTTAPTAPTTTVDIEVLRATPQGQLQKIAKPYFTRSISAPPSLFVGKRKLVLTESFDLVAHPPMPPGTILTATYGDIGGLAEPPPEDDHLTIPDESTIGFDLKALAEGIVQGAASERDVIERFRTYFSAGFRYATAVRWRNERRLLAEFLLENRTGNCTYFATSFALLLRAAGIPSRTCGGFVGLDPDPARAGRYLLWSGSAHAWCEYWSRSDGWQPVDATGWVPEVDAPDLGEEVDADGTPSGPKPDDIIVRDDASAIGAPPPPRRPHPFTQIIAAIFVGSIGAWFSVILWKKRRTIFARRTPRVTAEAAGVPGGSNEAIVLDLYADLQRYLARRRAHRSRSETPYEHARRATRRSTRFGDAVSVLAYLVDEIVYASRNVDDDERRAAEAAASKARREAK